MAELAEIEWYRGDTYPLEMLIQDEDDVAISLTGSTLLFTIDSTKEPTDDSTKQFEVAGVPDADQTTNTGKVTFTPTALQTDLTKGTYYYDIQLTNGSGDIRTIAKNKFKILQDITK